MQSMIKNRLSQKPTENEIIDATLDLMKDIEKNASIPNADKKDIILSSLKLVIEEIDPGLLNFVNSTLPYLIDVFVSLNKREFVIKAISKGLPLCLSWCSKK